MKIRTLLLCVLSVSGKKILDIGLHFHWILLVFVWIFRSVIFVCKSVNQLFISLAKQALTYHLSLNGSSGRIKPLNYKVVHLNHFLNVKLKGFEAIFVLKPLLIKEIKVGKKIKSKYSHLS